MDDGRRFVRLKPSGLVSRTGKIIVGSREPALDCTIIDFSAGGACLQVSDPAALPKRFELYHGGTRKKCCVAWTNGHKVGVVF